MRTTILVVLLLAACVASEHVRYDGWKVIQLKNVTDFNGVWDFVEKFGGSIWGKNGVEHTADIVVPPESVEFVAGLDHASHVVVEDVQAVFEAERRRLEAADPSDPFFDDFRNLQTVNNWINGLQGVEVHSIGDSIEGRAMNVVTFGRGDKHLFVHGTIHAREWITTTTANYLIDGLLTDEQMLTKFTWHVMPVANPDGYEYTWTNDRMWRKNRRVNAGSTARGVDLNRNFAKGFGGSGSSGTPSSQTYRGTAAFSEIESQHIRDYVRSFGDSLVGYMDMHCCGSMWMHPWGYTCNEVPPDNGKQDVCGKAGTKGISDVGGSNWRQGGICQVIYQASGVTTDWVYEEGVVYSYTIEEPGQFVQPASNIRPYGNQVLNGMKEWANCIDEGTA